jgi:tetratricopeptide (TPR) repeat protein
VALVGLSLVGWWASPWSPVALDRPAVHVARGDVDAAIDGYLALARGHGPEDVRGEALWRAAMLTAVDAGRVQQGIDLFRELQLTWPDTTRAVEADARLASLYQQYLHDDLRASEHWRLAAKANPLHPDAGRWLLDAGLALATVGRDADAIVTLQSASERPKQHVAAALALGRLTLREDPATAFGWYDKALRSAGSEEERGVARLGVAAATEHMNGHAALADIDASLTPPEARDQ